MSSWGYYIYSEGDTVYCGDITDPNTLDGQFEYIWFMHLLPKGEALQEKVQRNTAILEPLAWALQEVHLRADTVEPETAWRYANQAVQRERFLNEIAMFESALTVLRYSVPGLQWQELWPEPCTRQLFDAANKIGKSELYKRIFEYRIENGFIKKGHGDIKLKNVWFSDYYRPNPVSNFTDCITLIDPVDFSTSFSTLDVLSEAAMLSVDLQRAVSPAGYARFICRIITANQSGTCMTN